MALSLNICPSYGDTIEFTCLPQPTQSSSIPNRRADTPPIARPSPDVSRRAKHVDEVLEAIKTSIQQSLTAWAEDEMTPPVDSVDYLGDELYEILAARADDNLPLTCETVEVQVDIGDREQSEFEDERPPVLTAPDVPGTGMIKRGALKALIRHSGMSPEEFEIYAQTEDRMTQARAAIPLQTMGGQDGRE